MAVATLAAVRLLDSTGCERIQIAAGEDSGNAVLCGSSTCW